MGKYLISFTTVLFGLSLLTLAGTLSNVSTPAPTMYTLEDIYTLIHSNTTTTLANHELSPSISSDTLSSYSISQLYADLANLIYRENLKTGVSYLGVTGDYGNPDPTYATTTVIAASLTPTTASPEATGYSLDDVYHLIVDSATTTPHTNDFTPTGTPGATMHSLTDIYNALVGLIDPADVKQGITYLGQIGTYTPIVDPITYTITFDKNGGDVDANPTTKTANHGGNVGTLPIAPTRTGYTFTAWNTATDGSGSTFDATTVVTAHDTVYAIWTEVSFIITFDKNSDQALGSMTPQFLSTGDTLTPSSYTRFSCTFTGWATTTDGVVAYADEAVYPESGNAILYAIWDCVVIGSPIYDNCNPDTPLCTTSCNDIFSDVSPDDEWTYSDGNGGYGSCFSNEAIRVLEDVWCDDRVVLGNDGTCAYYSNVDPMGIEMYCPSFERLGENVDSSDCMCEEFTSCLVLETEETCNSKVGCSWFPSPFGGLCDGYYKTSCSPNYDDYFNFSSSYFNQSGE